RHSCWLQQIGLGYNAPLTGEMGHACVLFLVPALWRVGTLAESIVQPHSGEGPVPVGGSSGDPHAGRSLFLRQTGKEAQLDELGTGFVLSRQLHQDIVKGKQVLRSRIIDDGKVVQIDSPPAAAAFGALLVPRVIDKNTAHGLRSRGKEMATAIPADF